MNINPKMFRLAPCTKVNLKKWATHVKPLYKSKADYERKLEQQKQDLRDLQNLFYAHNRYSLLVIFQAMDAAGKDSVIKHVMSGINPQGCQVYSFKHPSAEELEHDFLRRTCLALPERGRIGIFNRSHYEEVLIVRVHPEILAAESLPKEFANDRAIWEGRYRSIVGLEDHLHNNGTRILKFFLHLSKDEQKKRFLSRIDQPEKNWKFNVGDLEERKLWDKYQSAYEACLAATSTKSAPWHIVPADDKKNTRLIVAQTIVETLKNLKMSYPKPTREQLKNLQEIRRLLQKEE